MCKPSSRSVGAGCIQFKRPVLPERYVHSLRFFLDGINPRKYPTTFFPEYVAVWDIYAGAHLVQ